MDLPLPTAFLYGILAGFFPYFICRSLSIFLTSFTTESFRQKIAVLKPGKLYHFHSLLASTVHALAQVIGVFHVVFYGRDGFDDALKEGETPALVFDDRLFVPYGVTGFGPTLFMGIFVGYLVADTVAAPSFKDMEYAYVVHHVLASMCWTYSAYTGVNQPLAYLLQFAEFSTLLLNVRQVMLYAGYKSSEPSVLITSLGFFACFAAVRVFPLPSIVRNWVSRDFSAVRDSQGMSCAAIFSFFIFSHVALQVMWFGIMVQKVAGLFVAPKKKEKEN